MKYITFLLDGMADHPLIELGNRTPLEAALTPNLDALAEKATFGTFLSLPAGFPTSSDVANMSVLGWNLGQCLTGRGPIESYGAGIEMDDHTIAFRMNLITVKNGLLEDYSAGHISNEESFALIEYLKESLETPQIHFQSGTSYRNLLYFYGDEYSADIDYDKPDSSHGMRWKEILPRAKTEEAKNTETILLELMFRSYELLEKHPINRKRIAEGKNPANIIWPWAGGKRPNMPPFETMYGRKGGIISAVDVILGLGRLGKMECCKPEGATGYIDTNYENKAKSGIELLKRNDFVYIHLEGIDEVSHEGDLQAKIHAIEAADERLIGVFLKEYDQTFAGEPKRVMVLPDHPVPVKLRQHTRDLVPVMISGDNVVPDADIRKYSETLCPKGKYTGMKERELMDLMFRKTAI